VGLCVHPDGAAVPLLAGCRSVLPSASSHLGAGACALFPLLDSETLPPRQHLLSVRRLDSRPCSLAHFVFFTVFFPLGLIAWSSPTPFSCLSGSTFRRAVKWPLLHSKFPFCMASPCCLLPSSFGIFILCCAPLSFPNLLGGIPPARLPSSFVPGCFSFFPRLDPCSFAPGHHDPRLFASVHPPFFFSPLFFPIPFLVF